MGKTLIIGMAQHPIGLGLYNVGDGLALDYLSLQGTNSNIPCSPNSSHNGC
jgi:hypothetical protein